MTEHTCPRCGVSISPGTDEKQGEHRTCPECGHSLAPSSPPEPPPVPEKNDLLKDMRFTDLIIRSAKGEEVAEEAVQPSDPSPGETEEYRLFCHHEASNTYDFKKIRDLEARDVTTSGGLMAAGLLPPLGYAFFSDFMSDLGHRSVDDLILHTVILGLLSIPFILLLLHHFVLFFRTIVADLNTQTVLVGQGGLKHLFGRQEVPLSTVKELKLKDITIPGKKNETWKFVVSLLLHDDTEVDLYATRKINKARLFIREFHRFSGIPSRDLQAVEL